MKISLIIAILLFISGCSVFSGNSSEELATANGQPILNAFKMPVKLKKKQTQAAALGDNAEAALVAVAEMESKRLDLEIAKANNKTDNSCYTLDSESFDKLQAAPKDTYIREAAQCQREQRFTNVIAMLGDVIADMSKPKSDLAAVADSFGVTIRSVAHEGTAKMQSLFQFGTRGLISVQTRKAFESNNEALRDVGIAGAENSGNTTVGNISVSNNQFASAEGTGGDGIGGAGGAGGGEASPGGEGGAGTGGDGTGTATNNGAPNNTVINIGGNSVIATDDAMGQAGTQSSAMTEPNSAATALDGDARSNAAPCTDCGDGDRETSDNDGNNNGTF